LIKEHAWITEADLVGKVDVRLPSSGKWNVWMCWHKVALAV
jgi:hypothetical protein